MEVTCFEDMNLYTNVPSSPAPWEPQTGSSSTLNDSTRISNLHNIHTMEVCLAIKMSKLAILICRAKDTKHHMVPFI